MPCWSKLKVLKHGKWIEGAADEDKCLIFMVNIGLFLLAVVLGTW